MPRRFMPHDEHHEKRDEAELRRELGELEREEKEINREEAEIKRELEERENRELHIFVNRRKFERGDGVKR
jgi:hypothetical protein